MLAPWRIARYVAAGGSSLLLQLAVQWLFIAWLAMSARAAIVLAYEIGLLAHFFVINQWVFGHGRATLRRLLAFHVAALTAEAITFAVAFLVLWPPVTSLFGPAFLPYAPYAATIAGTGAAFCWTFASCFFWIWRPRQDGQEGRHEADGAPGAPGGAAPIRIPSQAAG